MNASTRDPSPEAVVVGAGVSGLTCGVRLLEAGFRVTIVAREVGREATSGVAAAIWEPYAALPKDKVARWAGLSYHRLAELARVEGSGVSWVTLRKVAAGLLPDPWWLLPEHTLRRLAPDELPPGCSDGFAVQVPVLDTTIYLPWLERRVAELGGRLERREVGSLAELHREGLVVVNCTGLGAREVAGDERVFPARGQVVRVAAPAVRRAVIRDELPTRPTYVVPRSDDCVLGGTYEKGEWSTDPDPVTTADILERCRLLEPDLADAVVLEARVGLRPGRHRIRLAAERVAAPRCLVIHDYGHGGAGFTLSWGCADDVAALALRFVRRR